MIYPDNVQLDKTGTFKYVLVKVKRQHDDELIYYVVGKKRCSYHEDVYNHLKSLFPPSLLDEDEDIGEVVGGGRISIDEKAKRMEIYGYSMQYGPVDHEIAKRVIRESGQFPEYTIETSNEGY